MNFEEAYKNLNSAQKIAVDTIDGPLLVIAGPGTGKTQLLSARVAKIMLKTDTLPQNILCLTFTESGASNMRERLTQFIGQQAYDVQINTYHAFGSEIIRKFPQYFTEFNLQNPIDSLGQHEIFAKIVDKMSYQNPLKQAQHHIRDLISTISEVKRALLSSADLRMIAEDNLDFLSQANSQIEQIFADFTIMPRNIELALPYFTQTESLLQNFASSKAKLPLGSLANLMLQELNDAIELSATEKTKPLTKWKNTWLAKDANNKFILDGKVANQRVLALADVLEQYQAQLKKQGLYDFDDMILQAIHALQTNDDLKFSLQEQYLYVLLDEFQDTNTAQAKLVNLLSDNPVHEGRPNIMAVGDDDQAIYAFQGAHVSNMLDFANSYREVKVVNLSENYRSHADIITTAQNISEQIEQRLTSHFTDVDKRLTASNKKLPKSSKIMRQDFLSAPAEYNWVAQQISDLINQQNVSASEIAVLAPKHKCLEPLVSYLNERQIASRYEKRENILEAPIIKQLLAMSQLVLALGREDEQTAGALWSKVLSFEFWQIPIAQIWQISWQVSDSHGKLNWSKLLLNEQNLRAIAIFFKTLGELAKTETMEVMLDYLIGSRPLKIQDNLAPEYTSPLRNYYTNQQVQKSDPDVLYQTLSQLTVLRARLREHQATREDTFYLQELLDFVDLYTEAGERMINTSPYNQSTEAVQLMTVYKAKGLEFEHVFLLDMHDGIWGESSRDSSNRLSLPANLKPIRHAGSSQDERLRLLFVAITRAKIGLYLTSHLQSYSGKPTNRLKYLNEQEQTDGTFKSLVLPSVSQQITQTDSDTPSLQVLASNWQDIHLRGLEQTKLHDLLQNRLDNYKLSPTHLNSFIDLEHGGPQVFLMNTLLRFPQAPSSSGQFGNAIHETLEWLQIGLNKTGKLPPLNSTLEHFTKLMSSKHLSKNDTSLLIERGTHALSSYLAQKADTFKPSDQPEVNFSGEGVLVGDAHLSGKIDKLEIDKQAKTIVIVDYKTGKPHNKWESSLKLHKYKQQLYCYKILIESSHSWAGYTVAGERLDFIEPDENGQIYSLELRFNQTEFAEVKELLQAMWHLIMRFDFPDTTHYPKSLSGTKQFQTWLLDNFNK